MDQQCFDRILQGRKHFNTWRRQNASQPVDLRRAPLAGMDLEGYNFQGSDMKGANLEGASLKGANLRSTNLSTANLRNANLSQAEGMQSDLSRSEMQGANLETSRFPQADLSFAKLSGSKCSGVSLASASLVGADLSRADFASSILTNADLAYCRVSDTIFRGVTLLGAEAGEVQLLHASQLADSDLRSARLPKHIEAFNTLSEAKLLSTRVQGSYIVLLLTCVVCLVSAFSFPNDALLRADAQVKLPVFQTEVSPAYFLLISPFLILALFSYAQLYLERLWVAYSELPSWFPDGTRRGRRVSPWILGVLILEKLDINDGGTEPSPQISVFVSLVTWWLAPITTAILCGRFAYAKQPLLSCMQCVAVLGSAYVASQFQQKAHMHLGERHFWGVNWPIAAALISAVTAVTILHIFNNPLNYGAVDLQGESIERRNLHEAQLPDANLSHVAGNRVRLRGANLANATLASASLQGADLIGANLEKADLSNADLSRADLSRAILRGATLNDKTTLAEALLRGADLRNTSLNGVNLTGAKLVLGKLSQASFYNTTAVGTDFTGANLVGAIFVDADLEMAILKDADLSDADLSRTVGLVQYQIDQALGNQSTKLPSYIVRPSDWGARKRRQEELPFGGLQPPS